MITRLCLRVLLSVILASNSLIAQTNTTPISPSEKSFLNSTEVNELTDFENLTDADKVALRSLYQEPARVALEILTLIKALNEEVNSLEESLGREELIRLISSTKSKHAIDLEIEGVGKAELKTLGYGKKAKLFTRIVHYGSKKSYLFLDAEQVSLDYLDENELKGLSDIQIQKELRLREYLTGDLKRYISRQLIIAGATEEEYRPIESSKVNEKKISKKFSDQKGDIQKRTTWEKAWGSLWDKETSQIGEGRDTVIIWFNHKNGIQKIKHHTKPKGGPLTSYKYWKEYWWGVSAIPEFNTKYVDKNGRKTFKAYFTGDYLLGLGSATAQAGIALAFSALQSSTQENVEFTYTPAILSIIWGATIGVYNSTYRNWLGVSNSQTMLALKSTLVSLSFSYTLISLTKGFDALFALSAAALYLNLHLILNNLGNGWNKAWTYKIPLLRESNGENKGHAIFGFGKHKINLKISKAGVEMQLWYLPSYFFKLADMTQWQIMIPNVGVAPIGKILLFGSIPFFRYYAIRYAEQQNFKEAEQLRADWEKDKLLGIPMLKLISTKTPGKVAKLAVKIIRVPFQATRYTIEKIQNISMKPEQDNKAFEQILKDEGFRNRAKGCKSMFIN